MSYKIFILLLVCFLLSFSHANGEAYEGRKCVEKKQYRNNCNICFCSGNRKNDEGAWEPIIGCTLMACLGSKPDIAFPPPDFWEPNN